MQEPHEYELARYIVHSRVCKIKTKVCPLPTDLQDILLMRKYHITEYYGFTAMICIVCNVHHTDKSVG